MEKDIGSTYFFADPDFADNSGTVSSPTERATVAINWHSLTHRSFCVWISAFNSWNTDPSVCGLVHLNHEIQIIYWLRCFTTCLPCFLQLSEVDLSSCSDLRALLWSLKATFSEFKTHEHIENECIMWRLKNRLQFLKVTWTCPRSLNIFLRSEDTCTTNLHCP